jgi:hypothetical protein
VRGRDHVYIAPHRGSFEGGDPAVMVMPFVTFFVGVLGALAITTEFSTGSLGPSLVTVPGGGHCWQPRPWWSLVRAGITPTQEDAPGLNAYHVG